MNEPLNIDQIIEDTFLRIKKESRAVDEFGNDLLPIIKEIYQDLPDGVVTNVYLSAEKIDIEEERGKHHTFFTNEMYYFGKKDPFFEALNTEIQGLASEISAEKKADIIDEVKHKLGSLAEFDLPDLYNAVIEELMTQQSKTARKMGRGTNFVDSDTVIIGNKEDTLIGAFLVRIAVSGSMGKVFIVTRQRIVENSASSKIEMLQAIQRFLSQGPEAINDTL